MLEGPIQTVAFVCDFALRDAFEDDSSQLQGPTRLVLDACIVGQVFDSNVQLSTQKSFDGFSG